MVALCVNVLDGVVWFHEWSESVVLEVHGHIEEAHHLHVHLHGDLQVVVLEDLLDLGLDPVCLPGGEAAAAEAVVPVEAEVDALDGLQLVQHEQADQLAPGVQKFLNCPI